MLAVNILDSFMNSLPDLLVAILLLVLAFVVATIVKNLVNKLLKKEPVKTKIDHFDKKGDGSGIIDLLSKSAFLLVFLLFLPSALNRLNISGVSEPITGFVTQFVNYIPLILAAGILLYIGFFVANIAKEILETLLERVGINNFQQRYVPVKDQNAKLSNILSSIAYILILVPIVIAALDILGLQSISAPATAMLNSVISYIPKILIAGILVYLGIFLANMITSLLNGILVSTNVDNLPKQLNIKGDLKISSIISEIVKYIIIVFFTLEAIKILDLTVLTKIGMMVVAYIPNILSAVVILLGAVLLANWIESLLQKNNVNNTVSLLVKVLIFGLSIVMVLSQLGIAANIVEQGFVIVLAGIAVAFALAFGLGGKDFAKKKLEEVDSKMSKPETFKDNTKTNINPENDVNSNMNNTNKL
ncbi:mechanosensitive ion channel [Helcococcus kunzii]|uniref:mechanosensitive ion channel n=1 Tax=Helcococcus kunzii TaxID=40091 RepID=UPI0038A599C7